ncbi:MAG: group I truncated hemoglobin [Longimicrobiales bacterium]
MPRLRFHLIEQVCNVTGGPCSYTGRDMLTTHRGMGVTDGEFDALVEDLSLALDKLSVPGAEKGELLGALAPLRGQIVKRQAGHRHAAACGVPARTAARLGEDSGRACSSVANR